MLSKAQKTDEMIQECLKKKKLLLEDMTLPYLKWDSKQKQLMTSYTPVAASSHLGQDIPGQPGHYRSLMRIRPTILHGTQPVAWLLTQDNTLPEPVWHIPETMHNKT